MMALAGTEPSTLFGISQVVGVGSPDAERLQAEYVKRMGMISDPAIPLVANPDLVASLQATNEIALRVIDSTQDNVMTAVDDQASAKRQEAIRDSIIVGVATILALLLVAFVAASLIRPLRRLRDGALKVAHEDLARELERVRAGGAVGEVQPLPVHTTEEIGQVAHAVDELHEQAVLLAGEQANLQMQVDDMFETLSRRNRSLVDQQLTLIDSLERDEENPERLESLFKLDHLAARMRRNGANLMVLAGSKVPREQADPVPVAALVNAAASEVEDYTRVVTATVPESEVLGAVAGDLVHLLAELLDNALRYSPPISQVRVSAVHTGDGGLVIELSDIGLGMTESDLRVANTRLQSGGEVNPYTARHMGLFVVGRLAAQHGLVVRLRSTVVGEPNSGTTAGVFIPAGLLVGHFGDYHEIAPERASAPALGDDHSAQGPNGYGYGWEAEPEFAQDHGEGRYEQPPEYVNGHGDIPVSLLPQRNPGASGISGIPSLPVREEPPVVSDWADDQWPDDSMPAQTPEVEEPTAPPPWESPQRADRPAPTDTTAFFASREQAAARPAAPPASNGTPWQSYANGAGVPPQSPPPPPPPPVVEEAAPEPVASETRPESGGGSIFETMLSEWLIDDPTELAKSTDLDWKTVWDQGWEAAAAAEEAPVEERTELGLPMRTPGARLVPGAAEGEPRVGNGRHRHGDADDAEPQRFSEHPSAPLPRDPNAVRSTISSHFSGVHAGRMHAQENRESDDR